MISKKSKKKIIILGGHGDGISLASAVEDLRASGRAVMPYGFLNDHEEPGSLIGDLPVLGKIAEAGNFLDQEDVFFMATLLKVKESLARSLKVDNLEIPPERYFTLIHPQASVSASARIGYGTLIGPHVTVMPNCVIGNHCSLRASASIDHDCFIGNHCFIGPNATLLGRVTLADGAHIGPNACLVERVEVGPHTVVGAGSVVRKDLPGFVMAYGVPAKIEKELAREV